MTIIMSQREVVTCVIVACVVIALAAYILCKNRRYATALMVCVPLIAFVTSIPTIGFMINKQTDIETDVVPVVSVIDSQYTYDDGNTYALNTFNSVFIDGFTVKINTRNYSDCKVYAKYNQCFELGLINIKVPMEETYLYIPAKDYEKIYKTKSDK